MTPAEYVEIWKRWDERPGDAQRSTALSDAADEFGRSLGVSAMALRDSLASLRRLGCSREVALRSVRFAVALSQQ